MVPSGFKLLKPAYEPAEQKCVKMLRQMLSEVPDAHNSPHVKNFTMFNLAAFYKFELLLQNLQKAKKGHEEFIREFLDHLANSQYPKPADFEKLDSWLEGYRY